MSQEYSRAIRELELDPSSQEFLNNSTQMNILALMKIFEEENRRNNLLNKLDKQYQPYREEMDFKTFFFTGGESDEVKNTLLDVLNSSPKIYKSIVEDLNNEGFNKTLYESNKEFRSLVNKEEKTQDDIKAIHELRMSALLEVKIPTAENTSTPERLAAITTDTKSVLKNYGKNALKGLSLANMLINPTSIVTKVAASKMMSGAKWLANGGYEKFVDRIAPEIEKFEMKKGYELKPIDKVKQNIQSKVRSALGSKKALYAVTGVVGAAALTFMALSGDFDGVVDKLAELDYTRAKDFVASVDFESAKQAFGGDQVKSFFEGFSFESFGQAAQDLKASATDKLASAWDFTSEGASNLASSASEKVGSAWDTVSETTSNLSSSAKDSIGSLLSGTLNADIPMFEDVDADGADNSLEQSEDSLTESQRISVGESEVTSGAMEATNPTTTSYNIQKGDCLWDIVEQQNPEFSNAEILEATKFLAESNGLSNPDLIHAGSTLEIPTDLAKAMELKSNIAMEPTQLTVDSSSASEALDQSVEDKQEVASNPPPNKKPRL